jgi:hypothetical protein
MGPHVNSLGQGHELAPLTHGPLQHRTLPPQNPFSPPRSEMQQVPFTHDWPAGQAAPVAPQTHCPLNQVWPNGQTLPQMPRFRSLVCRSMQTQTPPGVHGVSGQQRRLALHRRPGA